MWAITRGMANPAVPLAGSPGTDRAFTPLPMLSPHATALPPQVSSRPLSEAILARYIVFGLLVAIVCAFSGVVRCDFIALDDGSHVVENPLVRGGLSWAGAKSAFTTPH